MNWFAYGMVSPALIAVLVVLGFPLVLNVLLAFTNASGLTGVEHLQFVGLDTFRKVLSDTRFQQAFGLTLLWTVANLAIQLALGIALALLLHATRGRLASVTRAIWVLPWLIPAASAFYVWRVMFNPSIGPLGRALADLGLDRPVLADPSLAIWGVIVAAGWKGYPIYMLMFYSALAAVPDDLYDAARVDGAGRWRVFRDIELPEIAPIVLVASILGFVWTFNWLTPMFVMTEGGPGGATTTVGLYIYFEALRGFRLSTAAVASTALVAIAIAFLLMLFVARRRTSQRPTRRDSI